MKRVQRARGTTAQNNAYTGAVGEITIDTDKDVTVVHDGTTAGGFPVAARANADQSVSIVRKDGAVPASVSVVGNFLVGTTSDSGSRVVSNKDDNTFANFRAENAGAGGQYFHVFSGITQRFRLSRNGVDGAIELVAVEPVALTLSSNNSERARITSAGYFKASNTGSYGGVAGLGDLSSTSNHIFQSNQNNTVVESISSSTGTQVQAFSSNLPTGAAGFHFLANLNASTVYQILANGNVQNTNNSYGAISDAKLKENVVDATPKLDKLNQLRVVNYNLIGSDLKQIGLIAQEVEQVFPGLVGETPDTRKVEKTRTVEVPAVLDEQGNEVTPATTREETYTENEPTGTVTKSIKYSVLVPMLLKALQEQTAIVEGLTARIEALENAA